MAAIIDEVVKWATSKLDHWEQFALKKILLGEKIDDQVYAALLNYMLSGYGLAELAGEQPDLDFRSFEKEPAETAHAGVILLALKNLKNVNALAPAQCLPFGPSLTVVFGANGSGKSGYARVLGCAGFSRSKLDIIPNINDPECATLTPSAEIEVADENGTRSLLFQPGQECSELQQLRAFDVGSVQEYLTKKNTFTFTPAGLSHLTRLADVTDEVRERLRRLVSEKRKAVDFTPRFHGGDSEVKSLISGLSSKTDLAALRELAVLSEPERSRMSEIDAEVAKLKSEDIPKQVADLNRSVTDLSALQSKLTNLEKTLTPDLVTEIRKEIKTWGSAAKRAREVGISRFKTEGLTEVGTDAWQAFIKAAKTLAGLERAGVPTYPQAGDKCLLCHQVLSDKARALILDLWRFLEGEARKSFMEADEALTLRKRALANLDLKFFKDESASYRYLGDYDFKKKSSHVERITSFLASCGSYVSTAIKMLDDRNSAVSVPVVGESVGDGLEECLNHIKERISELKAPDVAGRIKKLGAERLMLSHRSNLADLLPEIEEYVSRLTWAEKASEIGGSTRPITIVYNELFEKVVTKEYIEVFQQLLDKLGKSIKVRVAMTARKGETLKQLELETDSEAIPASARPDTVLSEGEKRAVALVDFLTEVTLDKDTAAIVLDDPVTSLDLEWTSVIASLLVEEAKTRQVIVFTHRLSFVHHLKKFSEQTGVDARFHWIKRGDTDGCPGYVFTDNSPAIESSFKNAQIAEDYYKEAKTKAPAEQEAILKQGFGALRTTYEWFIIYKLLGGVVIRFEERISPGRLKEIVWDRDLFNEVVEKHETLSRYIEGHLHSDDGYTDKPTLELLRTEIDAFNEIRKRYKELAKSNS